MDEGKRPQRELENGRKTITMIGVFQSAVQVAHAIIGLVFEIQLVGISD
jgi:hypothetical protein